MINNFLISFFGNVCKNTSRGGEGIWLSKNDRHSVFDRQTGKWCVIFQQKKYYLVQERALKRI